MATCKHCSEEITFGPHPISPEKLAPFNLDGTIHFGTCKFKGSRRDEYHYMYDVGGFITSGFKFQGDGNSQSLGVIIETPQSEIRCQTMKKGEKIFFELVGEQEIKTFISQITEFAKSRGIIK